MMGKLNIDKPNAHGYPRIDGHRDINPAADQAAGADRAQAVDRDRIEISTQATEVGRLVDQIKTLPDVRQDRVNEVRQQVASGHRPDADDIADAIIKEEGN